MKIEAEAKLVRIYVGSADQWKGRSMAAAILERARQEGLAGASISRGTAGFGAHGEIHTASLVDLSHDLPVVVEIVDLPERITPFLMLLDDMLTEALVVIQDCRVVRYVR